ncbi:MAG TPA: IS630 transposase-related protein [Chloroflexota bacterium]|jgi:transposase
MKAYSLDLRERVVRAVRERGQTPAEAARAFEVSIWTVKRYLARAEAGTLPPSPIPGRGRTIRPDEEAALREQWRGAPDARLADQCAAWAEAGHARVSRRTMARALTRLGWSRKKRVSPPPSGTRAPVGTGARR